MVKNNNFILYGAGMGGATFVCDICNFLKKYPLAVIDRKFKKEENFFDIPAFNLETFLKKSTKKFEIFRFSMKFSSHRNCPKESKINLKIEDF